MIELLWKSGDAKGYTDLLPSAWFQHTGYQPSLSHSVRGPHGGSKLARCAVSVKGSVADIDYGGAHAAYNAPNVDIGVMRLLFENDRRSHIQKVQWQTAGERQFVDMTDEDVGCTHLSESDYPPPFDPHDVNDGRRKIERLVVQRQGQPDFRNALMVAYGNRCAVTGCNITDVLEAAHISPYLGPQTNHVTNGLLLRADIHTLFDQGLIKIHSDYRITAQADIKAIYDLPTSITVPENVTCRPDKAALDIKANLP